MVEAVEKAGVPNMVWYNYRRVPAVTLAKQLIDEGTPRQDLPLPRQVPAGLDHLRRPAAGRRRASGGSMSTAAGTRRDRRPARPLHRHRPLAQRPHRRRVSAMTETFIKERKHNLTGKVEKVGIDDACAFLAPLRQRLARPPSSRPATPAATRRSTRFEINGETRLDRLGPARPAPPAVLRPPRRRHASAAGGRSTSPTAIIPT